MNVELSPSSIAPPAANYAHAKLIPAGSRVVYTSGVVPVAPDSTVPEDLRAQTEVVWSNIAAILAEAAMTLADIVSITTYVVVGNDLGSVMEVRDRVLAGHRVASTLVYVPALARPAWKLEIAVIASR